MGHADHHHGDDVPGHQGTAPSEPRIDPDSSVLAQPAATRCSGSGSSGPGTTSGKGGGVPPHSGHSARWSTSWGQRAAGPSRLVANFVVTKQHFGDVGYAGSSSVGGGW